MALFTVNTGCKGGLLLSWEWELEIPQLATSVFFMPGTFVKNGDKHSGCAQSDCQVSDGGRRVGSVRHTSSWHMGKADHPHVNRPLQARPEFAPNLQKCACKI